MDASAVSVVFMCCLLLTPCFLRWTLHEARSYFELCKSQSAEIIGDADQWTLNLKWLKDRGGRVPKKYMSKWATQLLRKGS